MKNIYRYIISTFLAMMCCFVTGYSQSYVERKLENIILTAVEKLNEQDVEGAKAILSDLVAADVSYDAAWYYMGQIALHENDIALAEKCFRKAVDLDPDNFWYRYKLAKLYVFISREVAVDMYENLMKDFPKRSELYAEMMELYISEREYEKALQTIYEMEKLFGPAEGLVLYAHQLLLSLGRDDEAEDCLRTYNSRYSSPYVLAALAEVEFTKLNDSTALAYYDEAIDLDPSFSPALLGKAEVCRITRRYDEFFPTLNRYVENSVDGPSEKTDYLSALIEKGDHNFVMRYQSKLDTTMMKLAQTHPKDSLVYNLRGMYYFYTGRNDDAVRQFRECRDTYPDSYAAAATLVEFLMYDQRWEELSEEGRKAWGRFPDQPAFLEMASVGDYNLQKYDKVLDVCKELIAAEPADSSLCLRAWSTMGDVYHILGDNKKAYKAYDKALKINPDYIYVLNNYAYFLSVEGKNLKKAYEMSRRTIEAEPDNATYLDTFGWILYLRGDILEAKSFFKNAMLHGGKDSAVILDHYAEVLYALKEYDLAFVYWNLALQKDEGDVPGLKEKVESKRKEAGK